MKKSIWRQTRDLWDGLCAPWDNGVAWILRFLGKGTRADQRHQARRPRCVWLAFDALEPRFLPSNASISVLPFVGTYNGQPHTLVGSAHGTSGENLSSLLNLGTPETEAGHYAVPWTFAGNATYAPASGFSTIDIHQFQATIKVNPITVTYDGKPHPTTAEAYGVGGIDLGPALMHYSSPSAPVQPGLYIAYGYFAGSIDYNYVEGTAAVTINAGDKSPPKNPLPPSGGWWVTVTPEVFSGVEGQALNDVLVVDDSNPQGQQVSYSVSIDWGDGQGTGEGAVVDPHNWLQLDKPTPYDEGTYTVTVTVTVTGASASATFSITIAEAGITATGASLSNAQEGQTAPQINDATLASFTDAGGYENLSDISEYSATINWGDGNTSPPLTVTELATVVGSHTYVDASADEVSYTITITIYHEGQASATVYDTFVVADAPLTEQTFAPPNVVEGQPFNGTVFTFTDANTTATTADFNATITWGDGVVGSGVISESDGTFIVQGTHTYADEYTNILFQVNVGDDGGAQTGDWTLINVGDVLPHAIAGSVGDTGCNCGDTNEPGNLIQVAGGLLSNLLNQYTSEPVRYFDGVVKLSATDLRSTDSQMPWSVATSWSNDPGMEDSEIAGNGWTATHMPVIRQSPDGNTLAIIANGAAAAFFDYNSQSQVYQPRFFDQFALIHDATNKQFVLTDEIGEQLRLYDFSTSYPSAQQGQFASFTDAGGTVTSAISHNTAGQITEERRTTGGVVQSWLYSYADSANFISNVTWRHSFNGGQTWTVIQQVAYTYYTATQAHGNVGDLMTALVEDANGNLIDGRYYRYYTVADMNNHAPGYIGGMKYVFNADSYARLVAALGSNLDSLSDAQVAPYADNYFEYDSSLRVTKEVAQGTGDSVSAGGLGTYLFSYTNATPSTNYNSWATRTDVTLPDQNHNIVYTNSFGEVMLSVYHDTTTGQNWDTYCQFDGQGRAILLADPSAVTGYNDAYPDLMNNGAYLATTTGLITLYDYATTTTANSTTAGDVAGYQQDVKIEQGTQGAPILQEAWQYYSQTVTYTVNGTPYNNTVYPVATDTVYSSTNGGLETTQHNYTWYANSLQIQSDTVLAPLVTSLHNGSNLYDATTTYFDNYGRPIWTKDPEGYLTYTAYDAATGAVTETIADVDTTQTRYFTNLPSGWTTPAGGGLNLVSMYQVDALGRSIVATDPNGNVTYTVYDDVNHEVRVYAGWNSTTNTPTGPTVVTRNDRANGYIETFTMAAVPHLTYGVPDGTEAITSLRSLERDYRNTGGQIVTVDSYFNLAGLTYSASVMGVLGTNFYQPQYAYDVDGRSSRVVSPTGTITRTVYDGQGRVVSSWIGTNDTPTTGQWSPTNPAGMIQVAGYVYDNGGVGDGDLTQETDYPGGSAAPRVTQSFFDWRDRLVAEKNGVQTSEDSTTKRPITYYTYDNLDEVLSVGIYDGDGVTITSTGGVPNAPSASLLRAYEAIFYDNQERVYRTTVYNVDQTTGAKTTLKTTNEYYNQRGELVDDAPTGGVVSKMSYDGAGRLTVTYTTNGAGSGWAGANTVANDIVYAQQESQYDADGNVIESISRERVNGETATGALGDPNTSPKARVSYAGMYYDQADRLVGTVDVGTNGGTAWTRPGSVPARSDTVLVTSYAYNDAGQVQDVTDPRGIDGRTLYDALGRVVTTIADYTDGNPTNNSNQTMAYTYDGSDHVLTATAVLPSSAVEKTQYIYGVSTTTGSYVTSNDILASIQHPDPTTGQPSANYQESFTVDGLGETLTSTDQNSHTTNYAYNVLGQQVTVTDPLTRATNYTFDARGNLSSVTDALNHTTSYAYDGLGRQTSVTDPLGHAVTTVYDLRDNVLSVTDANNNTTSYTYDALNRETSMTDALNHVTTWAYNVGGTTDTMTDADNNTTSFVYDSFGRLSQQTDPLGHSSTYLYDRDGNLAASTDRDNRTINYTYDNLNRETGETWLASGGGTDNTLSFTYDAADNPLTASNNAGTYTMAYDAQNRTKNVTEPNGVSLTFGYDAVGNRTSVSDSLGGAESSNYDAANELTSRSLTVGSTQIHEEEAYFADGRLQEQRSYGTGAPAAEVALEDYTYYADGRLSTLVAKDSAGGSTPTNTVMNYSYINDNAGRLSSKTENGTTTSYGYDNTNQLTTVNGSTVASYDATGNRTNTGYVTTTGNQLSTDGTWTYSYDGEGNNTYKVKASGENWTYTYDERNHLIKAEHRMTVGGTVDISATYLYDAFGNRIEKDVTQSGTTTVTKFVLDGWDPAKGPAIGNENWDVLADVSSSGSLISRYLRGDVVDQLFARIDKSGSTLTPYWYLTDNQGSVRMMVDNSGNGVDTVAYDAFGNITSETAPSYRGTYGYVGLAFDPETGLLYARGREDNQAIARWQSEDPIGFSAGDPNLYGVVGNEPTDYTDPSGLEETIGQQMQRIRGGPSRYPTFDLTPAPVQTNPVNNNLTQLTPSDLTLGMTPGYLNHARNGAGAGQVLFGEGLGFVGGPAGWASRFFGAMFGEEVNYWNQREIQEGWAKPTGPVQLGLDTIPIRPPNRIDFFEPRRAARGTVCDPAGPTVANTTRGWRVGQPINNLTASGNVPSWSAVRQRFWKNEAHFNPGNYNADNLARMQSGLGPQRINPRTGLVESMELHHTPPQRSGGLFDVQPVWPDDHALIDPFRITGN